MIWCVPLIPVSGPLGCFWTILRPLPFHTWGHFLPLAITYPKWPKAAYEFGPDCAQKNVRLNSQNAIGCELVFTPLPPHFVPAGLSHNAFPKLVPSH